MSKIIMTETNLKTITVLIAVLGLIFSVWQFVQIQKINAAKPYLEKKLSWCEEVVEITSLIAISETEKRRDETQRFLQMYWGVMGLVEKEELIQAMMSYKNALETKDNLGEKSLKIAHACRKELTTEWSAKWSK